MNALIGCIYKAGGEEKRRERETEIERQRKREREKEDNRKKERRREKVLTYNKETENIRAHMSTCLLMPIQRDK